MAITTQAVKLCAPLSLLGLWLLSPTVLAEEPKDWTLTPTLGLGLDYTDNLNLSATDEVKTFIFRASPGIQASRRSSHLNLGLSYRLNLREYSSSRRNGSDDHNLNAFADVELIDDRFFINSRATAKQQLLNNRDAGSPGLTPDNFINTFTVAVSPVWRQRIGDYVNLNFKATYDAVVFERDAEDSEGFKYNVSVDTHGNPNKIYWTLQARQDSSKPRGSSSTVDKEDFIEAQLGYRHSRQVDVRFGGGYVDNKVVSTTNEDANKGTFWSAGLTWTPTVRTNFNAYYSDRLQTGNGRGFALSHRRKRTAWSLSYQQSLSDVRTAVLQVTSVGSLICPQGSSINLADCRFVGPGENPVPGPGELVIGINTALPSLNEGRFVLDAINGNMTYRYSKTTVGLGVFANRRKYQDLGKRTEDDLGIRSNFSLQLSGRTRVGVGFDWSVLEPDSNATVTERDYRQRFTVGANYQLSSNTGIALSIGYNKRRSDDPTRQYDETGFGISANHRF